MHSCHSSILITIIGNLNLYIENKQCGVSGKVNSSIHACMCSVNMINFVYAVLLTCTSHCDAIRDNGI